MYPAGLGFLKILLCDMLEMHQYIQKALHMTEPMLSYVRIDMHLSTSVCT